MRKKNRILVYNDYNSYLPPPEEQNVVGTITKETGNKAPRHNYKLIVVYEKQERQHKVQGDA